MITAYDKIDEGYRVDEIDLCFKYTFNFTVEVGPTTYPVYIADLFRYMWE